ncbi:hypothetical protein AGDE_06375 [Angomonas deanei]|nr:hypothetical protein AGDE_06375 [Angomonas deanei]|eukprot:EPY37559.1 hypothetical protein AGDE_06375 [Angomonas deanei]
MNASSSPLMNTSRRVVPPFLLAEVVPRPPPGMWLMVSLVTGFFSGILCKVKDIMEGKHRPTNNNVVVSSPTFPSEKSSNRGNTVTSILQRRNRYNLIGIGERMYMVVPFCTGQWFAFILRNGWRGIVIANGTIVLSLGMVGYTMISYQLIRGQIMKLAPKRNTRRTVRKLVKINKEKGEEKKEDTEETKRDEEDEEDDDEEEEEYEEVVTTIVEESPQIDLIDLFSKLCTTSFGVVFASIIAVNVFVTSLAIPFFRALFHLNALTSGVGIVVELIMYEVA